MGTLSWIVLGLMAGVLAKLLLPGRDEGGVVFTLAVGLAGAYLGGWLGAKVGISTPDGLTTGGVMMATFGAFLILLVYYAIRR